MQYSVNKPFSHFSTYWTNQLSTLIDFKFDLVEGAKQMILWFSSAEPHWRANTLLLCLHSAYSYQINIVEPSLRCSVQLSEINLIRNIVFLFYFGHFSLDFSPGWIAPTWELLFFSYQGVFFQMLSHVMPGQSTGAPSRSDLERGDNT